MHAHLASLTQRLALASLLLLLASPVSADPVTDHTARMLGGLSLPDGSPIAKVAKRGEYKRYCRDIDARFGEYQQRTLAPMRAFAQANLADLAPETVFYPFSGPDIVNAVTLFSSARLYILLGLEDLGELPRPDKEPVDTTIEGLDHIRSGLETLLGFNFFRTKTMREQLGAHPYNGVIGMMLFFLSRTDHEVVSVRKVELSPTGEIIDDQGNAGVGGRARTRGVEVKFRQRAGGVSAPTQVALFFRGDISDAALGQKVGLVPMLMGRGPLVTVLKAASHLMYEPTFDDMRSLILSRSKGLVQEASGIPYHYLARNQAFSLSFFGHYQRPIESFANQCQPDLALAMERSGAGPLGFSYGYDHRKGQSHLVVGRRRAGVPLLEPVFDGTGHHGERTTCTGRQVTVKAEVPPLKAREKAPKKKPIAEDSPTP